MTVNWLHNILLHLWLIHMSIVSKTYVCMYSKVIRSLYFAGIWFGIFPTRKQAWAYHHKEGMSFICTLSPRYSCSLSKCETEICYQSCCVTLHCHVKFIQNSKLHNAFSYYLEKIPVFGFTRCIQQFYTDLCQSWVVFFLNVFFFVRNLNIAKSMEKCFCKYGNQ